MGDSPPGRRLGRLAVVCSAKGGEGSTSIAVGVAEALVRAGREVVLVEGDPLFGDLALALGVAPPATLDADDVHAARQLLPYRPGLKLWLPPQAIELDIEIDHHRTLNFISALQHEADHVVVDAPPLRATQLDVLPAADDVLLVARPSVGDLKNALVATRLMRRAGVGSAQLRLVVNGYDKAHHAPKRDISRAVGSEIGALVPEMGDDRWDRALDSLAAYLSR